MDLKDIEKGLLRRLFSTRVLKEIARGILPVEITAVREQLAKTNAVPEESFTLRELYEAAFRQCLAAERSEHIYKNALVEKIVLGRHSLNTASAQFEVRMRTAKLDVLIARDFLSAYEIKTELDELSRLPAQVRQYQDYCKEVWVLTCEKHLAACERQVESTVGLAVLTRRYQIRVIRPAVAHSARLNVGSMLSLLRMKEQQTLLSCLGVDPQVVPNTLLATRLREEASQVPVETVQSLVAKALRARGGRCASLARALPRSLAASVLAQDLTTPQRSRLIEAFKE